MTTPTLLDCVASVAAALARLQRASDDARSAIAALHAQAAAITAGVRSAAAEAAALIDAEAAELARLVPPSIAAMHTPQAVTAARVLDEKLPTKGWRCPACCDCVGSSSQPRCSACKVDMLPERDDPDGLAAFREPAQSDEPEPQPEEDEAEDEEDIEDEEAAAPAEEVAYAGNGAVVDETAGRRKARQKARKAAKKR